MMHEVGSGGPRRPWERQPGEPATAFAGFTAYRDQGARRTIVGTYRRVMGRNWARGASGRWNAWATAWRWRERAQKWDEWQGAAFAAAVEERVHAEAGRVAREQADLIQRELMVGQALISRAELMLRFPLATTRTTTKDGVTTIIIEPTSWSMGDVARMVDVGTRLRRAALDLPSRPAEVRTARVRAVEREIQADAREALRLAGMDPTDENLDALLGIADELVRRREQGA